MDCICILTAKVRHRNGLVVGERGNGKDKTRLDLQIKKLVCVNAQIIVVMSCSQLFNHCLSSLFFNRMPVAKI